MNDAGRDTGTWDTGPVGNDTAADFCGGLDDAATEEGAGMIRDALLCPPAPGDRLGLF
ncbi:DUF4259 domain-containing protein [Nocardiopsis lambiniae]|uniref:DUF4259 domain-containing protein n=1 Tax=Nocardiopsis lambiniae TaxID=3075539 RepID=A0ABU2MBS4_9ACTN|nr:DUF4259 domain-containing protein [Nocardiopsis sp. DSM 44743]MDT0330025.1 DUF4259 domain-containing protein [Nocardiopsis sp. DSM 44743]